MINVEIKLNKNKCTDKAYFDKMLKKFSDEVKRSFVMEELKLKRVFYKPSAFKKIKKDIKHLKWKNW